MKTMMILIALTSSVPAYAENAVVERDGLEKLTLEQKTQVFKKEKFKCYKEAVERFPGVGKLPERAQVEYTALCLESLGWGLDDFWKNNK